MNIHIDKTEFEYLMKLKHMGKFLMGSHIYGLDDEQSDKDYLIILYPFADISSSPFANHHQFQYKDVENNIDYNFVDCITFVKNLVSGDATVNFELLFTDEFFYNSDIGWLSFYKEQFKTYTVAKAYLGFADRDIRHFLKNTGRDRISAMMHIIRGYTFAQNIIFNGEFKLNLNIIKPLKNDVDLKRFILELPKWREKIKALRQEHLNPKLQNKQIPRFLDIDTQLEIHDRLANFMKIWNENGYLTDAPQSLIVKMFNTNENPELRYD